MLRGAIPPESHSVMVGFMVGSAPGSIELVLGCAVDCNTVEARPPMATPCLTPLVAACNSLRATKDRGTPADGPGPALLGVAALPRGVERPGRLPEVASRGLANWRAPAAGERIHLTRPTDTSN